MDEIVVKTVLGGVTLGDVIKHFSKAIESCHLYSEENGIDLSYKNDWAVTPYSLDFYGPHEIDFQFPLDTIVKIHEDTLELEHEGKTFTLTLFQKMKFLSLLP